MANSNMSLDELMSKAPWIRPANQTLFHLQGLVINSYNLTSLLQSFFSENEARHFALTILNTLSMEPLHLSGRDALQVLEQCWTGRTRPSGSGGEANILAQIYLRYSLGTEWEVVKTMSVLAVSKDAVPELLRFGGASDTVRVEFGRERPLVASVNIPLLCQRLHHRALAEDLDAAIQGRGLELVMDGVVGMLYCSDERRYDVHGAPGRDLDDMLSRAFRHMYVGRRDLLDLLVLKSKRRATGALQRARNTQLDEAMVMVEDTKKADVCMLITKDIEGPIRQSEIESSFAKALRDRRRVIRRGRVSPTYEDTGLCRYLKEKTAVAKPLLDDVEQDGRTWKSCGLLSDVIDGLNA